MHVATTIYTNIDTNKQKHKNAQNDTNKHKTIHRETHKNAPTNTHKLINKHTEKLYYMFGFYNTSCNPCI